MFKFIERLRKPIEATTLGNVPIPNIMKLKRRVSYLSEIHEPTPDFLLDMIGNLIKAKVNYADLATVDYIKYDGTSKMLTFTASEFNKEVKTFVKENKLYGFKSGGWRLDDETSASVLTDTFEIREIVETNGKIPRCIDGIVQDICGKLGEAMESFENLKSMVKKYSYLIPATDGVRVHRTNNNEWDIDIIYLTPELVDSFMEAARTALDEESATKYREVIIEKFREWAVGDSNLTVDYNKPSITFQTPEQWKEVYYSKIKPAEERRERCKDIIEEIRGKITEQDIVNEVKRRKLLKALNLLSDGELANVLPEDFKFLTKSLV